MNNIVNLYACHYIPENAVDAVTKRCALLSRKAEMLYAALGYHSTLYLVVPENTPDDVVRDRASLVGQLIDLFKFWKGNLYHSYFQSVLFVWNAILSSFFLGSWRASCGH